MKVPQFNTHIGVFISNESTTTPTRGRDGLDFTAYGGKKQGREVPQSLRVGPGAKHPVWKTQSKKHLAVHFIKSNKIL
jgi:hypothetical protein